MHVHQHSFLVVIIYVYLYVQVCLATKKNFVTNECNRGLDSHTLCVLCTESHKGIANVDSHASLC